MWKAPHCSAARPSATSCVAAVDQPRLLGAVLQRPARDRRRSRARRAGRGWRCRRTGSRPSRASSATRGAGVEAAGERDADPLADGEGGEDGAHDRPTVASRPGPAPMPFLPGDVPIAGLVGPDGSPRADPLPVGSPAVPYRHPVRIRYGECDMQKVVFNANYLAYIDDATDTWMRTALGEFEDDGLRLHGQEAHDRVAVGGPLRRAAGARARGDAMGHVLLRHRRDRPVVERPVLDRDRPLREHGPERGAARRPGAATRCRRRDSAAARRRATAPFLLPPAPAWSWPRSC